MTLNDEQNNIIRLFRIYKKFPSSLKNELDLLLTAENVMGIRVVNYEEVDQHMDALMGRISRLKIKDLTKYYDEDIFWTDKRYFENMMKQLQVYLTLRPVVLDKYPDLLI